MYSVDKTLKIKVYDTVEIEDIVGSLQKWIGKSQDKEFILVNFDLNFVRPTLERLFSGVKYYGRPPTVNEITKLVVCFWQTSAFVDSNLIFKRRSKLN